MSSRLQIDQVEAAWLALVPAKITAAYGRKVDVAAIGDKDFDDDGQLILSPPSVRIRFSGARYDNARDNQRLTYNALLVWEFLVFDESLRSRHDERTKTLILLAKLEDVVAGARLRLADGSQTEPASLISVSQGMSQDGPIEGLYVLTVEAGGIAQFSGQNARPA